MSRNFKTQLAGQIGESLVVAELGRRGIVATSFAGNVPDIDILAYRDGCTLALQVKSLRAGSASFDAKRFMQIEFEGDRQIITGPATGLDNTLIFVFVSVGQELGKDRFFILRQAQSGCIIRDNHVAWLAKHSGIRPRNPQSTHTAVSLKDLDAYHDNWALIESALGPAQASI
jgi:hypothetical protein